MPHIINNHFTYVKACSRVKENLCEIPLCCGIFKSGQQPKEDWLGYVKTAKARHKIKQSLRELKKKLAVVGREQLQRMLRKWVEVARSSDFGKTRIDLR